MEIIDTHTHLYLNQFDDDFDEMILRSFQCGIKKFVFPSISSKYNQKMITTLKRYPENFFLMAGLHPVYVKENFKDELKIVRENLKNHILSAVEGMSHLQMTYASDNQVVAQLQLMQKKLDECSKQIKVD